MEKINDYLFNSPIEVALRLLFLFNETNKALDTQRLIYYNYLLIHSSDVKDAPESLHPDLPNRSCEMLVNRKIVLKGLNLLISKGLIKVVYSKSGISYKGIENKEFLTYFSSEYSKNIKNRATWVVKTFNGYSDSKLAKYMNENLGKWGGEFSKEYSENGENIA